MSQYGKNRLCAIYSPPGAGKTSDALFTIPFGDIICPPDAIAPARKVVGIELDDEHVFIANDLDEARDCLCWILDNKHPDRTGILFDDISVLAGTTLRQMDAVYGNKQAMWGDFLAKLMGIVDLFKSVQDIIVVTGHERPYNAEKGIKGGLQFPSANNTAVFAAPFHEMFRLVQNSKFATEFKGAYEFQPGNPFLLTKARCGTARVGKENPANLAEILRASGLTIPYHPDHEWMEEWVQALYEDINVKGVKQALKCMEACNSDLKKAGVNNPLHRRWVTRNGYHRFLIRSAYDASADVP